MCRHGGECICERVTPIHANGGLLRHSGQPGGLFRHSGQPGQMNTARHLASEVKESTSYVRKKEGIQQDDPQWVDSVPLLSSIKLNHSFFTSPLLAHTDAKPIKLWLQLVQSKAHLIDIHQPHTLTIRSLQQLLQDTYRIPVEQQLLYLNRKRVEHADLEHITLLQYGFKNEDTVTVNLRLLGGGRLTRRKVAVSPVEEWLASPATGTGGLLRTSPTLADRLPLSPPTPAVNYSQTDEMIHHHPQRTDYTMEISLR